MVTFSSSLKELEFHVFLVTSFTGQPIETAEMRPRWFHINDIPYDQMWVDDRFWMPLVLAGKMFECHVEFDSLYSRRMLKCRVREITPAMA